MTAPLAAPVAGWYPDPTGEGTLRWWDGARWTTHLHGASRGALPGRAATFSARVYGYLVDALPLWITSLVLLQHFHRAMYDETMGVLVSTVLTQGGQLPGPDVLWTYGLVQLWAVTAIPGIILRVVYDVVQLHRTGATLGHRRAHLVVRDARPGAPGGAPGLGWRQALVRSLVLRVSAPTVLGWLLVVLWPLFDEQRRSLADLAAGTRVEAVDPGWQLPTR